MKPYYEDANAGIVLYCGDCREVLPTLGRVDAVVTDPPYGMNWNGKVTRGKNGTGAKGPTRHYGTPIVGDDAPFDPSWLLGFSEVLLWGFNHYPQHLTRGTVLTWIKRYETGFGSFLSDAEVAWFNQGCGVYCFRDMTMQGESSQRVHPTQKPVPLMRWCLGFVKGETICDPFCGSGTTLLAAKQLGRKAIGIEISKEYCEIAVKRLQQEVMQFDEPVAKPRQEAFDLLAV